MKSKKSKRIWYISFALFGYFLLSVFMGIKDLLAADNKLAAFFVSLGSLWYAKLAIIGIAALIVFFVTRPKLDFKASPAGHGQHGEARWCNDEERNEMYKQVKIGNETEPGILVGIEENCWVIDTSDNNIMILAPPSGGKTTSLYIPTLKYNANVNRNTGNGPSFIVVDIKGTLYQSTAAEMKAAGYRTAVLNMREVFKSCRYNILYRVNEAMDDYRQASSKKEKAIHYGCAERYAKIVASTIIDSLDKTTSSEGSEYFNESAKGLVIGLILLVSEHARPNERHIMSVFNLIIELNGQEGAGGGMLGGVQTTKLAAMMKNITNKRVQSYMGAATGADMRTMLNIFSSALSKLVRFVDAELEQLLCGHSPELDAKKFIQTPTVIYLICPDENTTRHFLVSLFIRALSNDLIEVAEQDYKGVMPRQFFYLLDEFGNIPSIQDIDSLFSAIRSRGGRIMCALQSYAQLFDNYSRDKANIIRDTCQMLMTSFVAPPSEETAKSLSVMLGNQTVQSGSVTISRGQTSSSYQMVGKPLVAPDELVTTMPLGTFIVQKGGKRPYKSKLKYYEDYLQLEPSENIQIPELEYQDVVLVSPRIIELAASVNVRHLRKGMFD